MFPTNRFINTGIMKQEDSLIQLGLRNLGRVHWNLSTPALYEEAIRRYDGMLSHHDEE